MIRLLLTKLTQAPYSYSLAPVYNNLFDDPNQDDPALNPETIFQVMNQKWTDWGIGSQYYLFGGQETWGGKATHSGRAQEYGFNDWNNVLVATTAVKAFTYPNPQNPSVNYVAPVQPSPFMAMPQVAGKRNITSNVPLLNLECRLL